jgi:outer membrane protein assembly factor BamE
MRTLTAILAALFLGACVHKIDVQQGNYVTQDLVERLKPGMTKAEVKQLLGTPLLADPFHANRWDYYFSNKPHRMKEEKAKLLLLFKDERLVSIEGEGRPAGSLPARSAPETPRPQPPQR